MPLPPFERVVAEHGPALLRFCISQAGPTRGEDVFQEAMLSALRAYGDLRDPGAVRSWLFSIAARKALDSHRARARAPVPVEEVPEDAAARAPAHALPEPRDERLWAGVRALPPKQRQAVALRYVADLSHAEIATALGTSEAAARRNVFEGVRRLRRELAGRLEVPSGG